jgi:cytochrome oxidase Cu insertion factor (SCO1/SenC/PrrC family)
MNASNQGRGRRQLVTLALVFALPIVGASALALLQWRPTAASNHGTLLDPPVDFRAVAAIDSKGAPIVWNSADGVWHILVRAPADCATPCLRMVDSMQRVWTGLGSDARHAALLWDGTPDAQAAAALAAFPQARISALDTALLPAARAPLGGDTLTPLGAWLVDPNGYLVMRYEPGFDPVGLRKDLRKLIR